jgi:hypothetical protein
VKRLLPLLLVAGAYAHEMTPAYPKLEPSYVSGVHRASLEMFNRREDVQFYEIGVFSKDWEPVPFVTAYAIMKLDYLRRVKFDVYIRNEDVARAAYVCSKSKLRSDTSNITAVSSRICSKFKQ